MTNDAIDYDHYFDPKSINGPRIVLPRLMAEVSVASVLDVGCGDGAWLRAAMDLGLRDAVGLDGIQLPQEKLHVPMAQIRQQNLAEEWDLGRTFDLVMCLEVAEHLEEDAGLRLVDSLVRSGKFIGFSAACPGQPGQHHVNCQWPAYWQNIFNARGFVCSDAIRWQIWDERDVAPWYRQNLFTARHDPTHAGTEPRIAPVLHPDILPTFTHDISVEKIRRIEAGEMPAGWYAATPFRAWTRKAMRNFSDGKDG